MGSFRRLIAAVTAAHFALGFLVATRTPGPLLSADDVAYLGMARAIAGDGGLPLPAQPPYGVLYPVLLAPGWVLGLDEEAMLTFARLVNAALGAALIPLLFVLIRRTTDTGPGFALVGSVVAASLPAAMLHSSIVWAENLLPVVVVLGLLTLDHFLRTPTPTRGLVVVAAAIAQVAVHPRSIPAAAVLIGAGLLVALRDRRYAAAGAMVAGSLALYGMVEWARRAVQDAAFGSSGLYDAGDLIDHRGLDEVPDMLMLGTGTVAYLLMATAAVAFVGAWAWWRQGLVGRVAVAMVAATVVMAAWFLTGIPRGDKWLHGRYVEAVAAPLVALGIVHLARVERRWLAGLAGAIAVAGVWAAWAGPGDNWSRPRSPVMMLGVEAAGAPFGAPRFEPGAAASVAIVALVVLWLLARYRPLAMVVALIGLLTLASMSVEDGLDDLHAMSVAAEADALLVEVGNGETLAVDPMVASPTWIAVAWRFGLDDVVVGPADGATYILVPADTEGPIGATEVGSLAGGVLYRL